MKRFMASAQEAARADADSSFSLFSRLSNSKCPILLKEVKYFSFSSFQTPSVWDLSVFVVLRSSPAESIPAFTREFS